MTMSAIDIVGLSKVFRIWGHPRDMLKEVVTGRRCHTEFTALNNVSLTVPRGAIVGIMGRNGAGKSTLLRTVAGTLDATSGKIEVNGRISAILELGTGFHPDYSGRENIKLGGMCLGLSHADVKALEDEIIDFSELREFIDQPFRTYSSGMQARLTFAVATSIDPDILIVDEALSVGDARFQLKSFDRVRKFKQQGKTILLVTHDINTINSICDEAVLLERGVVLAKGLPATVGNVYHELLFGGRQTPPSAEVPSNPQAPLQHEAEVINVGPADKQQPNTNGSACKAVAGPTRAAHLRRRRPLKTRRRPENLFEVHAAEAVDGPGGISAVTTREPSNREHRYGDGAVRIVEIEFRDEADRHVSQLESLINYDIVCKVEAQADADNVCFGFLVRDTRGLDIFGWDSRCGGIEIASQAMRSPALVAGQTATIRVRFRNNLAGGTYFLTVALANEDTRKHDLRFDAVEFAVKPTRLIFTTSLMNLEVGLGHGGTGDNRSKLWELQS